MYIQMQDKHIKETKAPRATGIGRMDDRLQKTHPIPAYLKQQQ